MAFIGISTFYFLQTCIHRGNFLYTQIFLYLHLTFIDHISHNKMVNSIKLYFALYEEPYFVSGKVCIVSILLLEEGYVVNIWPEQEGTVKSKGYVSNHYSPPPLSHTKKWKRKKRKKYLRPS